MNRCKERHPQSGRRCELVRGHSRQHQTPNILDSAWVDATTMSPTSLCGAINTATMRSCLQIAGHVGYHRDSHSDVWNSRGTVNSASRPSGLRPPSAGWPNGNCPAINAATGNPCTGPAGHGSSHKDMLGSSWYSPPSSVPAGYPVGAAPGSRLTPSRLNDIIDTAGKVMAGDPSALKTASVSPDAHAERLIQDYLMSPKGQEFLARAVLSAMDSVASKSVGGSQ